MYPTKSSASSAKRSLNNQPDGWIPKLKNPLGRIPKTYRNFFFFQPTGNPKHFRLFFDPIPSRFEKAREKNCLIQRSKLKWNNLGHGRIRKSFPRQKSRYVEVASDHETDFFSGLFPGAPKFRIFRASERNRFNKTRTISGDRS